LANTFSDQNTVINASTDPVNVVDPMKYNLTTGALTNLGSDWTPGAVGDNCNAVRVATAVPTPLFFSGVRNVFGSSETGSMNINVNAVAHLPCPGSGYPTEGGFAPIALRQCKFDTASDCEANQTLFQSPDIDGGDNSAFTTYNLTGANTCKQLASGTIPSGIDTEVVVGDTINLVGSGQVSSCLKDLEDHYTPYCTTTNRCNSDPPDARCTVRVPIVDQCTGGGAGAASDGKVVGFATVCFTGFDSQGSPKFIKGSVECNEYAGGTGGAGGICLGTYTRSPILVQ
jgi:hypothetical protein